MATRYIINETSYDDINYVWSHLHPPSSSEPKSLTECINDLANEIDPSVKHVSEHKGTLETNFKELF